MFTQKQFEYLARCQWLEDWHASYFTTIVRQCHESDVDEFTTSVRLEQAEFDELMAILSRADQEDLFNLQAALNSLNLLPCTMFTPLDEQTYPEAISCQVTAVEGDPTLP